MKIVPSIIALALSPAVASAASCAPVPECRYLPSDEKWPSDKSWDSLNTTVGGRLIKIVPVGSPCHDPNYDAVACTALQTGWKLPQTHISTPSSLLQDFFANQSCDPFTDRATPCTLGNYVSYAVSAQTNQDVALAVKFAKLNNIRLVIRNTGHDYFGRSTGSGALSVWTHNLKDVEYVDYAADYYTGPAYKVGAGIQGADAVEAAHKNGLTLVSGECPTVGLAGYTMGGGHSALSTAFGLGADQTLEFEVVTAAGDVVKANPKLNADLYWALSGGGGGSYGVVTSMTIRAHPAGDIGGAKLQMPVTNKDAYYEAIEKLHEEMPGMVDKGATVVYYVTAAGLDIQAVTVLNSTGDYVRDEVLKPFTDYLAANGLPALASYTTQNYRDHYDTYMGPLPNGHQTVNTYQFGGRLIPRKTLETNNLAFSAAVRELNDNGVIAVASSGSFKGFEGMDNAVLPVWRDTIISMQLVTYWNSSNWDKMLQDQTQMTDKYVPMLAAVTPDGGTYLNEANFNQPNWEKEFHGDNYDRLVQIKKKWDPASFFYTYKGIGSNDWSVENNGLGRMCRCK